jgi:hypothetical protein
MKTRLSMLFPAIACMSGLAAPALAQGTNACTTPQAIVGVGTFAFNNTAATTGTQGQNESLCDKFGLMAIERDVWFAWTAPSTNTFEVSTCGGTSMDSKVAIYPGNGCPANGTALACNDDSCGFQSRAQFAATSGSVYTIQLGRYADGGSGASGTFSIQVYVPPPPCSPSVGPDVIVGDITGPDNYSAAGGLDAISLGTDSCNIGTQNVSWIANNNLHPVIGGTLYRYSVVNGAGRFEQIGQSWLKHGFTALTQNLCCTCSGQGGAVLGVGCSDPYTAARNGSQGGLGPKWQVNAHTGVFTYPPANPAWSGSVARRLEYLQTDVILTAGTRYFGEAHYVTQDDATAGNQNNNASYREMSATASSFSFAGATQRMMSAIRAWDVCDPAVVLNDVQVVGDGLYIVGYRTTSLGSGQHHYEYAVYNMNGDRNIGSFSVPIPAGVNVTNIGFHDVAYRNGDGNGSVNFSGTDWVGNVAGGAITWACETQGTNNNANAIRWGTTYNFRFDANAAPAIVSATLGLWKSGAPASVTSNVEGPSGPTSFSYCPGDGTGTACPCANNSTVGSGQGCLSSIGTGGLLAASGTPSISADTLVLTGSLMPNSSALYFQGTTQQSGGAGSAFGDGLRCAAGSVLRLGTKINAGGTSQYPELGDLSISVKGANAAGNVRMYQCWYRNAAAFCTASTFNLSNGWQLTWQP